MQDGESAEHIMNQRIYGARARYIWRDSQGSQSRTVSFSAKVEPCQKTYFTEVSLPHNVNIEKLYCLSEDQSILPEQHQDLKITGRFDSKFQGKLSISIEKCLQDCESSEEIESFLNKANVAVYFVNYGLNLENFQEPYKKNLAGLFTSIDSDFSKSHEIFMKTATVQTDSGKIMKDFNYQNYTVMDSQRETISSLREGNLYHLVLQMSSYSDTHIRTYKKLFSVIAEIGGYIKAFLLLAYLYRPFLQRKYYIELINHLYKVDGGSALRHSRFQKDENRTNTEGLIAWRKFDFFGFKKKKKNNESIVSLEPNSNDSPGLSPNNDLGSYKKPSVSKNIDINLPPGDQDESLIEFSNMEPEDTIDEKKLKYSLSDWLSVLFPFLRGENERLYKKVKKPL